MKDRLDGLLEALAAGDSLGSTSEFVPQGEMPGVLERRGPSGWPLRQVGGGAFGWAAGAPTDDTEMAARMVASFRRRGGWDPADVAERWRTWAHSMPRDIGSTTRRALGAPGEGVSTAAARPTPPTAR